MLVDWKITYFSKTISVRNNGCCWGERDGPRNVHNVNIWKEDPDEYTESSWNVGNFQQIYTSDPDDNSHGKDGSWNGGPFNRLTAYSQKIKY
jgi:hypothetical protein